MIPKKIHFCWFSNDPFPPLVQKCLDSWHRYLPDYEIVRWDAERLRTIDSLWLRECLQERKWAFAADFVRLWAVYHEGGIYLDSDVEISQSLDPFLQEKMFIGRESVPYHTFDDGIQVFLTSHCFGAEAGHPFLELNLSYYENRHFIQCPCPQIPTLLRCDMLMMPYIQSRLLEPFGYNPKLNANTVQRLSNDVIVYPDIYFGKTDSRITSPNNYAHHWGQSSWRTEEYLAAHPDESTRVWQYSFKYKIRWRIVAILKFFAKKMGYYMEKIDPDGYE